MRNSRYSSDQRERVYISRIIRVTLAFLISVTMFFALAEAGANRSVTHGNIPPEIHGIWMLVQNTWKNSSAEKEITSEIFFWEISSQGKEGKIKDLFWNLKKPYQKIIADIQTNISPQQWFPDSSMLQNLAENLTFGEINDYSFASAQDYYVHMQNIPAQHNKLKIDTDTKSLIVNEICSQDPYPFKYVNLYMIKEKNPDLMTGGFRSRSDIVGQIQTKEGTFKMYRMTPQKK